MTMTLFVPMLLMSRPESDVASRAEANEGSSALPALAPNIAALEREQPSCDQQDGKPREHQ